MKYVPLIAILSIVLLVFIFIARTVIKTIEQRGQEINMFSFTRMVGSNFNDFVKIIISSNIGVVLLVIDFGFVFAIAALIQDEFSEFGSNWQYVIAFLISIVPFAIATWSVQVYSGWRALSRWYSQYYDVSSPDYCRSKVSGKGLMWTKVLSDKTSFVKRSVDEYYQDRFQTNNYYILIILLIAWSLAQFHISHLIDSKVTATLSETVLEAAQHAKQRGYAVMIMTISLDIIFILSTISIIDKIDDFEFEFIERLKRNSDFTDIESFYKENKNYLKTSDLDTTKSPVHKKEEPEVKTITKNEEKTETKESVTPVKKSFAKSKFGKRKFGKK